MGCIFQCHSSVKKTPLSIYKKMPGIQILLNSVVNLITETVERSQGIFTLTAPSVSLDFVTYLEERENYNFESVYFFFI